MRFKRVLLLLSFLLVAMIFIGSVAAIEDNGIDNDNLTSGSSSDMISSVDENVESNSNENALMASPKTTTPAELDPEVQDRVVNAMERFEAIYPVVVNEFGEELAPAVMDLVMDTLLDM